MQTLKAILKVPFALLFLGAGIAHFVYSGFFLRLMPPYLPYHLELIHISGVIEITLALLLLIPVTSRWAAWGIIALLIAVFPANIQMSLHPETFPEFNPGAIHVRLLLQAVLIAWAYWYARPSSKSAVHLGKS